MAADASLMEKLTALCKRRGFIFQSSEIYGGIGGFWDYGPLGVELKRNIKDVWWRDMVSNPPAGADGKEITMLGLDCSIIMNPKVWEASGHVGGFKDPMVECPSCKARTREDFVFRRLFFAFPEPIPDTAPGIHDLIERFRGQTPEHIVLSLVDSDNETVWANFRKRIGDKKLKVHEIPREDEPTRCEWFVETRGRRFWVPAFFEDCPDDFLKVCEGDPCPNCGEPVLGPRQFDLMFKTHYGALEDSSSLAYLRPETAQGIFVNFKNVLDTSRIKIPFGIAQIGKSFRNEINPRNYTFRSREFEQMEMEFFCHPDTAAEWFEYWRKQRFNWYVKLGLKSEKLRLRDHEADELSHYSTACADIEYLYPFSDEFQELEGVAHRGCYDLTQHQKHSGKDLTYFDDDLWQADAHKYKDDKDAAKKAKQGPPYRYLPHVIEPAAGADRTTLAILCEAYSEDEAPDDKGKMQTRVLMKFHARLAPIKAAVFPLVNKEGMPDIAEAIYRDVKKSMPAFLDVKGAIGRRYRRQDEVGTPFCITVDGQTLEDGTVTVRNRDSLEQVRIGKDHVVAWLQERLNPDAGRLNPDAG